MRSCPSPAVPVRPPVAVDVVLPAPPAPALGVCAALAVGALVAAAQTGYDRAGPDPGAGAAAVRLLASFTPDAAARAAPAAAAGYAPVEAGTLPGAVRADDLAALAKGAQAGLERQRRTLLESDARAAGSPSVAVSGDDVTAQPVQGRITSLAGPRWGTTHYGLDIANRIGTPIFAVADGVVERSGPASGFGLWVVVRHADGTRSIYGHINRAFVAAGERVSAGDRIAEVGNRGQSTGPHLHLEIRQGSVSGERVDPMAWLRDRGLELV